MDHNLTGRRMVDARNEPTAVAASMKMDDVRDEALSNRTSSMNDCKNKHLDGSVSFEGRVSDRKKFFERHICEQQQKENALISPTLSSCASLKTGQKVLEDLTRPSFVEERTDSENFFRSKNEPENTGHRSRNVSERTGPEQSFRAFHPKVESKVGSKRIKDRLESFEPETSYFHNDPTRQFFHDNKLRSTDPSVGNTAVVHSRSYIKKTESLDLKIMSLQNVNSDTQMKGKGGSRSAQIGHSTGPRQNEHSTNNYPVSYSTLSSLMESEKDTRQEAGGYREPLQSWEEDKHSDDTSGTKNQSNFPMVKIQVTTSRVENQNGKDDPTEDATRRIDIDEMITEFQQASAKLSDQLMGDRSNVVKISQDDGTTQAKLADETNSYDDYLAQNNLTANDFDELTERLHVSHSKEKVKSNDYVCPSESTDYSVDSKGNSKAPKSVSSKSAKSAKSNKSKGKVGGMGKMLKKAKKGMGKLTVKGVTQISQITSKVKNTMKTKPTKPSLTDADQPREGSNGISEQANSMAFIDIFDKKLARELVNESKGKVGILTASQYLDSGKRLLRNGAELKKANNLKGSNDAIRKAHTYAYVARQLAKQYLLACRKDLLDQDGEDLLQTEPSVEEDEITAFEDLFLSFLQCVGPCSGDYTVEDTRHQVDEALEILSKLSEEERTLVKRNDDEASMDRKIKVQGVIEDARNPVERNDARRIHRFLSGLRSFYEIDTTMKLSKVFLKCDQDREDDDSVSAGSNRSAPNESLSYNYSESLKFDNGRSFHTRSFTTAGSMKQEQPSASSSFRRGRNSREESLADGIRPGKTVVSISLKNKKSRSRSKSVGSSNKKKWGRKQ